MSKEERTGLSDREKFVVSAIALLGVLTGIIYIGNATAPEWDMHPIVTDYTYNYTDYPTNKIDLEVKKGTAGGPAVDLAQVGQSSPELVNRGKELYAQNCVACHGPEGKGDGAAAVALNPKPRNFHSLDGWTNGPQINQIFKTVTQGVPGTGMPPFDYLPAADRFAVIHYIRSFASYPAVEETQLQAISTEFNLSAGGGAETVVQVPVQLAMENMIAESEEKVKSIEEKLLKINKEADSKGAQLFNRVTTDRKEAVAALMNSEDWKGNLSNFRNLVSYSSNTGFSGGTGAMSQQDWTELHNYLKSTL